MFTGFLSTLGVHADTSFVMVATIGTLILAALAYALPGGVPGKGRKAQAS